MRSPEDSPTFSAAASPLASPLSANSKRLRSLQAINFSLDMHQRLSQKLSAHDGSGDCNNINFNEFKVPPPPLLTKSNNVGVTMQSRETPKVTKPAVVSSSTNLLQNMNKPKQTGPLQTQIPVLSKKNSTETLKTASKHLAMKEPVDLQKSKSDDKLMEVDPQVGKLYELGRRLGKGAYGIVWEAKVKSSGRQVALKKIYEAFRNTTDSQRTYREIIFLKGFGHHPNIISVIGGHKAANNMDLYLVFPYMKFDLYKVIEKHPAMLTESNTEYIAYQLAIALNYLHSAEIIHRDLKPANILLDEHLHVELADLGLSRTLPIPPDIETSFENGNDSLELTDYVATRWYRPPEIILSCKIYTKSMDMWAFGCILGEMLLKKVIFAGESANHQLQLIMQSIFPPTEDEIHQMCENLDPKNMELIKVCANNRGQTIPETFQDFDCATVDIIERLLYFSPHRRLTVEEVMAHPFFLRVRKPVLEYKAASPFTPPISDNIKLQVSNYQKAIYTMIDNNDVFSSYTPQPQQLLTSTMLPDNMLAIPPPPPFQAEDENDNFQYSSEEISDNDQTNEDVMNIGDNASQTASGSEDYENEYDKYTVNTKDDLNGDSDYDNNGGLEEEEEEDETFKLVPVPVDQPIKQISQSSSFSSTPSYTESEKVAMKQLSETEVVDKPDIVRKFELLCKKHDVEIGEFGDLGNDVNKSLKMPLKAQNGDTNFSNKNDIKLVISVNKNNENHYDYISKSSFKEAVKGTALLTSTSLVHKNYHSKRLPSERHGDRGDNFENMRDFDDFDYNEDLKRIQDTMAKTTGSNISAKGFINPYKPKGLKTSSASSSMQAFKTLGKNSYDDDEAFLEEDNDYLEQLCRNREIKNSKSLPTQIQDKGERKKVFPRIDESNYGTNHKNKESSMNGNVSKGSKSDGIGSKANLSAMVDCYKMNGKLDDMFKTAMTERQCQLESRVKGRVSLSHDAIHTRGNIFSRPSTFKTKSYYNNTAKNTERANERSSGDNVNKRNDGLATRQKLPTDYSKMKFSFNPYSQVDEDHAKPQRPYGGRSYGRVFHGPTFKKSQPQPLVQSYSDTEATSANHAYKYNFRYPQNQGQGESLERNNSAYFPHKRPKQRQLHSMVTPSRDKDGFAVIHPIPSSDLNQFSRQRNDLQMTKEQFRYPSFTNSSSSLTKDVEFNPPESVTIRNSELQQLRNSLRNTISTKESKYL